MEKEVYILDKPGQKEKILNVAAYCRVSSDSNEQRNSLENQPIFTKHGGCASGMLLIKNIRS